MKVFQFPKGRYRSPGLDPTKAFEFSVPPEDQALVGEIQGQAARSPEEWRVSVALHNLERNYVYQYGIGPPGVRGSYSVDFLVEDVPKWFPLEVQSLRWHTGIYARGEKLRAAIIERTLGAEIRYVWEDELQSQGEAMQAIKDVLFNPVKRTNPRV